MLDNKTLVHENLSYIALEALIATIKAYAITPEQYKEKTMHSEFTYTNTYGSFMSAEDLADRISDDYDSIYLPDSASQEILDAGLVNVDWSKILGTDVLNNNAYVIKKDDQYALYELE